MRKFLIFICVVIFCILAAYYLGSKVALNSFTTRAINLIYERAEASGTQLKRISYDEIKQSAWNRISLTNVAFALRYAQEGGFFSGRNLSVKIKEISLELLDFKRGQFLISLHNVNLLFPSKETAEAPDAIEIENAEVIFISNLKNKKELKKQLDVLASEAGDLATHGTTNLDLKLSGISHFQVAEKPVQAHLFIQRSENKSYLRLEEEDLKKIVEILNEKLTFDELTLLSQEPVRAPKLLQIRNHANRTARQIARLRAGAVKNSEDVYKPNGEDWSTNQLQELDHFPEDAYRVTYWSYLLTRQFGAPFAKQVTDAHENNPDNVPKEREMDYNNSKMGREYALAGLSEPALLEKVLKDPKIIRRFFDEVEEGKNKKTLDEAIAEMEKLHEEKPAQE